MKTKEHTKLITYLERHLADVKASMQHIRQHRNAINKASTAARKIDAGAHIYVSCDKIYVHVSVRELDGFKAGKLIRALQRLTKVTGVEFDSSSDCAESGNRDYRGYGELFVVTVSAYLNEAPKNCRKVVVRTERVERPVYELVCK